MHTVIPPVESSELSTSQARLLGVWTDYDNLCAPHVPAVREVLEGKRHRYKVHFNNAVFVFHHGCLMVQVLHDGLLRALPPFGLTSEGQPYLRALPEHQRHWLEEFMTLPKDLLMFYFSLLKTVFGADALQCRWENPQTGRVSQVSVPEELRPILAEVGWKTC